MSCFVGRLGVYMGELGDCLPPRCQEVFNKWKWEQTSLSHFRTPFGDLDLLYHGEHTVRQIMRLSWQMVLASKESRINSDDPDLQAKTLVLATHQAWINSGNQQQLITALGAGNDGHKLACKFQREICCSCGKSPVSRHHLTWHCPDRPVPESLVSPVSSAEEKLLLCAITRPPLVSRMAQVRRICNKVNEHTLTLSPHSVIACDGSMISKCGQSRAAWAVATAHACFGASLPGLDQHIHSGEAWAVLVALRAADLSNHHYTIISDCKSVLQKAWRVRAGGALPRFAPGLWKEISLLSPQSMLHFVPSHGKNQNWRPPGQHSASVWRHLNSLADAKANSIAHRDFQHLKTFCDDFDIAANWSHLALTRQMQIIAAFEQQLSTQTTLS